jgi:hypothetical protein
LVDAYERSHWVSVRRAPLANPFFRPEEEHVASGESDIVPPLCRRDKAVEKPGGGFGALDAYLKTKRLSGLLATGGNLTRLMEHRRHSKGVPRAVGEVLLSSNHYPVLCRHA